MMNCDDFKKAVLAEPHAQGDGRREHADACADCTTLEKKVMQLEQRLTTAMSIPVPASVENTPLPSADSVADDSADKVVSLAERRKPKPLVWLAVAASVALVSVFVLRQPSVPTEQNGQQLANAVLEHIVPELAAMRVANTAVSNDKLVSVLSPTGSTLAPDAPFVSYAKSCIINGQLVPHLVMQGENGPVTVLLMPNEKVDGPVSFMRDGIEGVILPVGDGGSIAILGRDGESVEAIKEAAMDAVGFSI